MLQDQNEMKLKTTSEKYMEIKQNNSWHKENIKTLEVFWTECKWKDTKICRRQLKPHNLPTLQKHAHREALLRPRQN